MENAKIAAIITAAALAIGGAALIFDTKDIEETPQIEVSKEEFVDEKLLALPDGGASYLRSVRLIDGGIGQVIRDTPGCKRRPVAAPKGSCRLQLPDGGQRDPGDLNRYPASDMVGIGCRPVACSVFAGEDADEDEIERIKKRPPK